MSLDAYREKRDFSRTPEPAASDSTPGQRFVVQRHHARRLHYDFRLEANGVLVSWAIPHGPSQDPKVKRMAVHVEDHPLDYGGFEGTIPKGNYGAGSVMLWDVGTYRLLGDGNWAAQYERGDLKLEIHGTRVRGEFALVRTHDNQWLLIKKKDAFAVSGWSIDQHATSVTSGRTQSEIAAGVEARPVAADRVLPVEARERPMPRVVSPMLAEIGTAFTDATWWFELKWDGWRALTYLDGDEIRILSRRANSLLQTFPELSILRSRVKAKSCILDGEIVCLDARGVPDFNALQHRMRTPDARNVAALSRSAPVTLYLFDILYLDGWDLTSAPLHARRRLLEEVVEAGDPVRFSDYVVGEGEALFKVVCERGLEGVVAKQRDSSYENRRSGAWRKIKAVQTMDCVIAGWTKPDKNTRSHFKSLILALREGDRLIYVGNAGSGFSEATLAEAAEDLVPLRTEQCPFGVPPPLEDEPVWVRPEKVCFVKYQERTRDGILRFPVFLGMRPDKGPEECDIASEPLQQAAFLSPDIVNTTLEVEGVTLKFTHLDKVYFPADNVTKRDLVNFYADVAPLILPHLTNRPLNLKRYPNGITGEYFFQKHGEKFPAWIRIDAADGVICNDRATLLFLANLGCIDQNPLQSRIGSLDTPDWMLLDLDPQECPYDKIVAVALVLRELLEQLGLQSYPKTTGGRGMHIYVPVAPEYTFEQTTMLAQVLARVAATRHPDLITLARAVSRREKNRVYIDYPQGGRGRSISAPYCVRPVAGATVATPLRWEELRPGLHPSRFSVRTVRDRLEAIGDIFAPVLHGRQRLQDAISRLDSLL